MHHPSELASWQTCAKCIIQILKYLPDSQVSWVQPRVLTRPQMADLKGRLDGWITKVNSAALSLEEESVGLAES